VVGLGKNIIFIERKEPIAGCNLAMLYSSESEIARLCASLSIMGVSQLDCLHAALSSGHGIAYSAFQRSQRISYLASSGTCSLPSMADWRMRVPAAEAKKAGNASKVT